MQRCSVGIIGLGLIGGSIGKRLHQCDWAEHVLGWDRDEHIVGRALVSGAITEACRPEEMVQEVDLLILATPPSQMVNLSQRIAPCADEKLKAVTDTASTKHSLSRELSVIWKERYVGLHPMAGKERGGIDNASADLFAGAVCALVPTASSSNKAVELAKDLICALGSHTVIVSPEEHDKIVAVTSHLPMFLATALAALAGTRASQQEELPKFVAGGFRDTTRVASCPPWLIADVWETNKGFISQAIKDFMDILSEMSKMDPKELLKFAANAKESRDALLAQRGETNDRN